jgi:hypothetical protein
MQPLFGAFGEAASTVGNGSENRRLLLENQ